MLASVDGTNALRPLNNDYDADGDKLTISATTNPSHGTISVVGVTIINYQPTTGYSGPDSFTYTASDRRGQTSTATINLTADNSAPVANPDTATTPRDAPVIITILANDSDPNGDTLTVLTPSHGVLDG